MDGAAVGKKGTGRIGTVGGDRVDLTTGSGGGAFVLGPAANIILAVFAMLKLFSTLHIDKILMA
jgi:hypothetical protein